jgi:hypothetical protein
MGSGQYVFAAVAMAVVFWLLFSGTYRILARRSVAWRLRVRWVVASVMPLLGFYVFHHFHALLIDEERYWFRDNANMLPFLIIGAMNYVIGRLFVRRYGR